MESVHGVDVSWMSKHNAKGELANGVLLEWWPPHCKCGATFWAFEVSDANKEFRSQIIYDPSLCAAIVRQKRT